MDDEIPFDFRLMRRTVAQILAGEAQAPLRGEDRRECGRLLPPPRALLYARVHDGRAPEKVMVSLRAFAMEAGLRPGPTVVDCGPVTVPRHQQANWRFADACIESGEVRALVAPLEAQLAYYEAWQQLFRDWLGHHAVVAHYSMQRGLRPGPAQRVPEAIR